MKYKITLELTADSRKDVSFFMSNLLGLVNNSTKLKSTSLIKDKPHFEFEESEEDEKVKRKRSGVLVNGKQFKADDNE